MPANLTPEYKKAEEALRQATTTQEKVACLEHMLRVIPKHKGTDHLQADIKSRLSKLRAEERRGRKQTGRRVDPFAVPRSGAGQVVLIGRPNVGKSALVRRLTNARVEVAAYPFSTTMPVPGIAFHEDVPIQLIDMPPVMDEGFVPGAAGTVHVADLVLIVVDLAGECLEDYEACRRALINRNMMPVWRLDAPPPESGEKPKVAVVACNKVDPPGARDNVQPFTELLAEPVNAFAVSAETGEGLPALMAEFFRLLRVIRVYAKRRNQEPDLKQPFVLPADSTVEDMARAIHRDLPSQLKFAKVWGTNVYPGEQVKPDHVLSDKDVVELHAK